MHGRRLRDSLNSRLIHVRCRTVPSVRQLSDMHDASTSLFVLDFSKIQNVTMQSDEDYVPSDSDISAITEDNLEDQESEETDEDEDIDDNTRTTGSTSGSNDSEPEYGSIGTIYSTTSQSLAARAATDDGVESLEEHEEGDQGSDEAEEEAADAIADEESMDDGENAELEAAQQRASERGMYVFDICEGATFPPTKENPCRCQICNRI